jgi:superfamily I DNA/RNA helicase
MTDVEAALEPLHTDAARQLFAIVKLVLNRSDDLSWWTLLKLCRGVSDEFIMSVADQAVERGERFSQQLTSLDGVSDSRRRNSANQAKRRFDEIVTILDRVAAEVSDDLNTFLEWFKSIAAISSLAISEELEDVLVKASAEFAGDGGIREFVPQLEPLARDVALEGSGVAIMTCGRSKGLTFDVVVTLGVEQELFPSPMSSDPNEDRRLLYVATTRARLASYLTMASYRQDATAYTGSGDAVRSRSRCSFLYDVGIPPRWIDDAASFAPETIVDPALS